MESVKKIKMLPPQKTRKRPNGGNRGQFNLSENDQKKKDREALIQNIDQIDEICEGFLANGYVNMIKRE